jgi:hypothetical protein
MARNKMRISQAKNDIRNLQTSLQQYVQDYGAYPPDAILNQADRDSTFGDGTAGSGAPWPTQLSPNECLVWFLTRTYSKDATAAGRPAVFVPAPPATWQPETSLVVFSRVAGGPYASWSNKQLQDYNQNGYKEFVDPWGRPYFYRAYPRSYALGAVTVAGGKATFAVVDPNVQNLCANVGRVRITGCANAVNNGTFDIQATAAATFSVTNAAAVAEGAGAATVQFLLNKPDECDLYSIGANGLTRAGQRPTPIRDNGLGTEWKPTDTTQFNNWPLVWGTPGDGNDWNSQTGNAGLGSERDKDDLSNWQ